MKEEVDAGRIAALAQVVFANYGTLVGAAYESYPGLLFSDPEKIVASLNRSLVHYTGPMDDESFLGWACEWVAKETKRYEFLAYVLKEHSRTIRSAIRGSQWTSILDAATDEDDIFAEVMALVFLKAHALRRKGTAKLSSRLTALAKKHVAYYHNHPNKRRSDLVLRYPSSFVCEHLSPEELDSMQPTRDNDSFGAWAKRGYERSEVMA